MNAPLSEQQLAEIAARAERVRAMKFVTGLNAACGHFDTPVERELYTLAATCWNALQAQLKDSHALLAEATRLRAQVDEMVHVAMGDRKVRLFDEVGEVRNARVIADAQLARANTRDRLCREKSARVAELEAERADREDDLAAALGRSGLDWTDLIDVATTAMRRAEGLDATDAAEVDRLTARVSVLEAERHSTNEALSDTAEALREKAQQLADAEQLRLTPLERLTLRFALELVDDAIANDPTDITDADRAAMARLRALSTGPVVAYRNPWRPGVLLCVEHGEGWEGMKPLSVEDLPNGGTCTAGDPADPDDVCGRDVLATEAGERA